MRRRARTDGLLLALQAFLGGCLPYATGGEATRGASPPSAFDTTAGQEEGADRADAVVEPAEGAARPSEGAEGLGRVVQPGQRWWRSFGDSELNSLVERALRSAPDMEAAWARLEKSHALAGQAEAPLWPQLTLQGQASYSESLSIFGTTSTMLRVSGALQVGWEVDLFARFRARAEAADAMAEASRCDVEAAALAIAAETADAWFSLRAAVERRLRLQEQLGFDREQFDLVERRYRQGLVSVLDLHQQRGQLVATEGEYEAAAEEVALAVRRLAVWVGPGVARRAAVRASSLPLPPPMPEAGVPADLLARRPDLQAARRRIRAADLQVGAAVADWFPSLRLGALPAYTYFDPDLGLAFPGAPSGGVDGFEWSVRADLQVPLFDGLRRYWATRAAKADLRAAVAGYDRLLRRAVVEVESAFLREREARRRLRAIERRLEVAEATLEAARDRYRQGLLDYLPVLQALQGRHALRMAELQARLGLLRARVALHKALGGAMDMQEPSR